MKKVLLVILSLIFLCGCSNAQPINETTAQLFEESTKQEEYVKSVWITYYELSELIGNNSEQQFEKAVSEAYKELYSMGFNTVTVQVRAFADAFYNSDYFPLSKYCFGEQGGKMKYDVLKILCTQAQLNNIRLEAWINPYRVSFDNDIDKLCDDSPAKKWYSNKKTKSNVYVCDSGIYFNPASDDVKKLIVNGVREIVLNYNVSAIHFDDYFYPSTDKKTDSAEYKKYKKSGGKASLGDFRREKVSDMIKSVYKAIRDVNSSVSFGISPAANIKKDYEELYADVEAWAGDKGCCDYICPQIYFGFKNINQPFMFTVKKWIGITNKTLYVGLPLYKAGKKDEYAALKDKEAINEFKNNKNIIARQINYLAKLDDIKGFYVFSYSSLFDEKNSEEVANMLKAIQNTNPNLNHRS